MEFKEMQLVLVQTKLGDRKVFQAPRYLLRKGDEVICENGTKGTVIAEYSLATFEENLFDLLLKALRIDEEELEELPKVEAKVSYSFIKY